MRKNKKQIIITISLIIILILAVIGVSYAAFSYVGRGEKVNQITTGTISMDYSESDNVISINNALPTTDETGKVRLREGEYFDFSVTTNLSGEAVINFEIAAEDFEDNTFDGSNVKFYLTKLVGSEEVEVSSNLPAVYSEQTTRNNKTGRPAGMMILLTGSTSTQGEETTNYRLRLYVDENYNPQGDGGNLIFKTRINVYGKVNTNDDSEKIQLPIMRSYKYRSEEDYHNSKYKNRIKSIVAKKDAIIPETAITIENGKGNYWDVSETQDDSVVAYLEENGTIIEKVYNSQTGKFDEVEMLAYKLIIGGDGCVAVNSDSSFAFSFFGNLQTIDLNNLNTSDTVNMKSMFGYNANLLEVNVSNFDTSRVTDMNFLFGYCNKLTIVDVSNFNTSNVIDMSSMFSSCRSLTELNISNFDTSKVLHMYSMFESRSGLTSLDLSSFNTSEVINMNSMFSMCSNLINIKVSNLWNIENTSTIDMFFKCGTDHVTVV